MEEHNEVWEYVEKKMKISFPKYIKYILMYCGYNNCHTIAAIKQTDLKYFVNEVRRGNLTNFFRKLGIKDVLEGSSETAENFEFVRGHEKLLMAVVNFVKEQLNSYGADVFLTDTSKLKSKAQKIKNSISTTTKDKTKEPTNGMIKILEDKPTTVSTTAMLEYNAVFKHKDRKSHQKILFVHEDIIRHQTTLLTKIVTSLCVHTPKMYQENIEVIARKISTNLVQVITISYNKPEYSAKIKCPYCLDVITVINTDSSNENGTWITSDFDDHLKNIHKEEIIRKCNNADDGLIPGFVVGLDSNPNFEVAETTFLSSTKLDNLGSDSKEFDITSGRIQKDTLSGITDEFLLENCNKEPRQNHFTNTIQGDSLVDKNENETIERGKSNIGSVISGTSSKLSKEVNVEQISKGAEVQFETGSCVITPKVGDYVLCSFKEYPVEWPSNLPLVKYCVGQILFIKADFNEIWIFVEQEMKMKIPSHIKHILKYCGFENCYTISMIEENDIEYFENEVRKGEIVLNETNNVLVPSTSENFEFSRGHKKLIMAITKLVNEKLNKRGIDGFSLGFSMPKQRKRTLSNATTVSTKISKLSTNENSSLDCFSEAPEPLETLQEHKSTLLRKMILSLITHTPEMFANVSIIRNSTPRPIPCITAEYTRGSSPFKRKDLYRFFRNNKDFLVFIDVPSF